MHRISFFLLLASCFLLPSATTATPPENTNLELQKKLATEGRGLIFARRYEEAKELCEKLVKKFPESPIGYLGMMAIYQSRNFENFDFRFQKDYEPWHKEGRKRALRITKDPKATTWDRFITGATLGLAGLTKVREKRWWSGLRDGMIAVNSLRKSVRRDPLWADSYLGLGLYEYWRSVFTRRVWWLPFFSDQRKLGIGKVRRATEFGEFTNQLGEISLAFIYYEEKRYRDAIKILKKYTKQYPNNIILKNLYGHSLTALKRYKESQNVFGEVLNLDPQINKAHLFLGMSLAKEGKDLARAEGELKLFLTFGSRDSWKGVAHLYLGEIAYKRKNFNSAIRHYQKAIELNGRLNFAKARIRKLKEKQRHSK